MRTEELDKIREAIGAEDYCRALALWNGYAAQLRKRHSAVSRLELEQALEFIAWARGVLGGARARSAGQLSALRVAGAYGSPPPHRPPLLRTSV